MTAFWFCPIDGKLGYGDGRKPRVGSTHKVDGDIQPCKNGLHSSKRLIDALKYAPGHVLYLVEEGGTVVYGEDKLVSSSRNSRLTVMTRRSWLGYPLKHESS